MSFRWRQLTGWGWLVPLCLAVPTPAFALQAHAYEGIYVHQVAHLFFLLAMVFFALHIQQSWLSVRRAWQLMAAGAWLLALWNLWAFCGHIIEGLVPESSIVSASEAMVPDLALVSWWEVAYFIVKMDHLLAVPAIFCFYFGLRGILQGDGRDMHLAGEE